MSIWIIRLVIISYMFTLSFISRMIKRIKIHSYFVTTYLILIMRVTGDVYTL